MKITRGDALDPCSALVPETVPDGYRTLTAEGITIAWEPSVKLEPTTLAYLTAGLLAQIGIETGTQPRNELLVVVYSSLADFRQQSGAPEWADGLYDGAVRLPAVNKDFGIALHALRHELVHAQIHAAIGCSPVWLDEGLAQHFANTTRFSEWLLMIEGKHSLGLAPMSAPSVEDVAAEPELVYAQAQAMVVYALSRGDTIADMIHDRRGAASDLWSRRYGGADEHAVLDALAKKMFDTPLGPQLDALLGGEVCCRSISAFSDLTCHAGPRRGTEACFHGR